MVGLQCFEPYDTGTVAGPPSRWVGETCMIGGSSLLSTFVEAINHSEQSMGVSCVLRLLQMLELHDLPRFQGGRIHLWNTPDE